eukprot:gene31174-37678_t
MGNSALIGQTQAQTVFLCSPDILASTAGSEKMDSKSMSVFLSSGDENDSTERIKYDAEQQFRETIHFLNPQFMHLAHRMMDEEIDRRAFMSFLEGDLWLDYLDSRLCSALMDVSNQFAQVRNSSSVQSMSDQAKEVYFDELDIDSALNADRMPIEDCFSSRELRYLTLCIILSAYFRYCTCSDSRPLYSLASTPTFSMSNSPPLGRMPDHSASPRLSNENSAEIIDIPVASSFFISPIELIQRIKCSTSTKEFSRILSHGTWLSEVCLLIDRLGIALSLHRSDMPNEQKTPEGSVVYSNREYAMSFSSHSSLLQSASSFSPQPSKRRVSVSDSSTQQCILVSTLPVVVSSGQYMLCMHHSITKATTHQQILLRLSDLVLLVANSMLC